MSYAPPAEVFSPAARAAQNVRSAALEIKTFAQNCRTAYERFWGVNEGENFLTPEQRQATFDVDEHGYTHVQMLIDYGAAVAFIASIDPSLVGEDGPLPPKYHSAPGPYEVDETGTIQMTGDLLPEWADPVEEAEEAQEPAA